MVFDGIKWYGKVRIVSQNGMKWYNLRICDTITGEFKSSLRNHSNVRLR